MKKRLISLMMILTLSAAMVGCGNKAASTDATDDAANTEATTDGKVYKVGIVQYVDDASLNQIVANLESQLDALGMAAHLSMRTTIIMVRQMLLPLIRLLQSLLTMR